MASLKQTALGLAALLGLATPAMAQAPVTAVMAHVNVSVGEEVFLQSVPKRMGYFKAEGIDPAMIQGAAGGVQAGQVLLSGRAQFAWMLAENVLQLREQGGDVVAFYTLKQNNGFQLAVPPDSPIKTLADLRGKTVGFAVLGSGAVMLTKESAVAAGVPADSFTGVAAGTGGTAAAALRAKRVDGLVLWDAMYGSIENLGVPMRYIDLPILDTLAGYSLVTSPKVIAEQPKLVEGYCRAIAKGLLFARANPAAAVRMFHEEFPTTVPAQLDADTAVKNDVNVLNRWLERAMLGVPMGQETGAIVPAKWAATQDFFARNGALTTTKPLEPAYTSAFTPACNDFDHAAVLAAALAAK